MYTSIIANTFQKEFESEKILSYNLTQKPMVTISHDFIEKLGNVILNFRVNEEI